MNFYEFLDKLDTSDDHALIESIRDAYALLEMKDPMDWSKGQQPDQRIGKTGKNIQQAKYKAQHPVVARFHRTKSEYADAIEQNGLKRKSDNYGENTDDTENYDNVIWTADNPDEIPVLRHYDNDAPLKLPRYSNNIDTFKITMPKDVYNNTSRMKFDNGHRSGNMVHANPGENTLNDEGEYKIDVFDEDIPAKYLTKLSKIDPRLLDELEKFTAWKYNTPDSDNPKSYAITWDDFQKRLPKPLRQYYFNHQSYASNMHQLLQQMMQIKDYISKNSKSKFDWNIYNSCIQHHKSPADAVKAATKKNIAAIIPWDTDSYCARAAVGHITKGGEGYCNEYHKYGNPRNLMEYHLTQEPYSNYAPILLDIIHDYETQDRHNWYDTHINYLCYDVRQHFHDTNPTAQYLSTDDYDEIEKDAYQLFDSLEAELFKDAINDAIKEYKKVPDNLIPALKKMLFIDIRNDVVHQTVDNLLYPNND